MRLSGILAHRLLIFGIFFGASFPVVFIVAVLANVYAFDIFWMLLVGAVCGTVFWHRIPDQIQNLLIFNLVWWPIILVYGIFADLLDIDDETSSYVMLSLQSVILCFGIIKYILHGEKNEIRNQSSQALSEDKKQAILFFLLGKMAKADGQVSKDEKDAVGAASLPRSRSGKGFPSYATTRT